MNRDQPRRWKSHGLARWGILILGLLPALTACYPYNADNSGSGYDIAITQYDPKENFYPVQPPPNTTFYLVPTVEHIVPPGGTDLTNAYDPQILNQVAANMVARQYTRDLSLSPATNFIVTVAVTTTTYTGYSYWGGWWGYGCYCYGGYYPYMQPYSFTTGTILINMADQSLVDMGAQTAQIVWGCAINGLLNSGATASRITNQINQCFNQSPYLGPS